MLLSTMDLTVLDRLYLQIQEGWDIPTPKGLLRVKRDDAAVTLPGMPYSMVKNLAHAVYWQELWLGALEGASRPANMEVWRNDFRDPDPSEWEDLRKRFVEGLAKAREYCGERFKEHRRKSDEDAVNTLLAIAVHASYHMGQINVLKRALKGFRGVSRSQD
jgi:hypothetical protein